MYDDNRYIIITIVHLHLQTHNMSLQFNGNDAVVIYLKSKWIEINLLCDVTLLTANFSLKYDIYFEEETISIFLILKQLKATCKLSLTKGGLHRKKTEKVWCFTKLGVTPLF